MSVESLLCSLELECFDNTEVYETQSDVKALVLTYCYGRGKPKSTISIPRLPDGVPTRVVIPQEDLRELLPTKKRAGRGRARVLSQHVDDILEKPRKSSVLKPPVRSVPQKTSLFELPAVPHYTDVDSFDYYISDEEDEGYEALLPSQRGITNHPFGAPPKRKDPFNVKSKDDFPSLSTSATEPSSVQDTNNSATSARFFPPLPPKLSKKVTNIDIILKPMKKSKKKRKNTDSSAKKPTPVTDGKSQNTGDVDSGVYVMRDNVNVTRQDSTDQSEIVLDSPDPSVLKTVSYFGEPWQTVGSHVVQIDGLPDDIQGMDGIVSSFGSVLSFESRSQPSGKTSFRVKYTEAEAAEFATECLHEADGFVPDTVLQCYMVTNDKQ